MIVAPANSCASMIGNFGRGPANSSMREPAPKGADVGQPAADGAVRGATEPDPAGRLDITLDPDDTVQIRLGILARPRSAWSRKTEQRSWVESF